MMLAEEESLEDKAQGVDHLDALKQMKDMEPCFVAIVKVYFEVYEPQS